jgi:hypothetical protein
MRVLILFSPTRRSCCLVAGLAPEGPRQRNDHHFLITRYPTAVNCPLHPQKSMTRRFGSDNRATACVLAACQAPCRPSKLSVRRAVPAPLRDRGLDPKSARCTSNGGRRKMITSLNSRAHSAICKRSGMRFSSAFPARARPRKVSIVNKTARRASLPRARVRIAFGSRWLP